MFGFLTFQQADLFYSDFGINTFYIITESNGRKQAVLTGAFDSSGGIFGSNCRTVCCLNFPHARQYLSWKCLL